MSYSVNGKTYTEHSLMDEIVYNCKTILSGIVVKNDTMANYYETEESLNNATYYSMVVEDRMTFQLCPFTVEMLEAYSHYTYEEISLYLNDRNKIPVEDREDLVNFACEFIYNNYEEMNNYYRSLNGLPPYGTTEYDIYLTPADFPANYDTSDIDFTLPLHKQPKNVISVLNGFGYINKLAEKYKYIFNYKYINFLGDKKLDIFTIRKAQKWEILYMPAVERMINDRFSELFYYNRKIYIDRYDQEAIEFNNEYYSVIMIINLIAQTFADMIVEVPEWYIRRDIFDMRSVQYFLESYGVAYYKQIPLRFQIRIVKALNKLIKYKSSNRNNFDIVDIFGLKGTKIYKYYLFKKQKPDGMGGYIVDPDPEKMFELEFIKTEIDGTYADHLKDRSYTYTYDEITLADKYWDGEYFDADDKGEVHKAVYHEHIIRDFTVEPTKLMSLESEISLKEYLFQLKYFVGMITDSRTTIDITAPVPTIAAGESFNLADLFTLLVALSYSFDEMEDKILLPRDVEEEKDIPFPDFKATVIINNEFVIAPPHEYVDYYSQGELLEYFNEDINYYGPDIYYDNPISGSVTEEQLFEIGVEGNYSFWEVYAPVIDPQDSCTWINERMPQMFYTDEHHRVYGFNMEADLGELAEIIGYRHSEFNFKRGYTLEDLGVEGFIPPVHISTIEELNNIYNTNKAIYDHLEMLLLGGNGDSKVYSGADDYYEYEVIRFVIDYLFTKTFDYDRFSHNGRFYNKYEEILLNNNYTLYLFYNRINTEPNIETRRDNIRNAVSDIIITLEYYLSADGLDYIFNFVAANGLQDILSYIHLLINFFKSYKVSFLDPTTTYIVDDKSPLSNGNYSRDQNHTLEAVFGRWDKEKSTDITYVEPLEYSYHYNYSEAFKEVFDLFEVFEPDPDDDYDYNGGDASNVTEFKMVDGGEAHPNSCIPFKMVDGGDAAASGRMDLWDIDGGGAELIPGRDEFDVDGGYPFHPNDYIRQDYFVSHFIPDINAGYATTRLFRSTTGIIRMIDRQRKGGSERMSQYMYNSMIEGPDGYEYSMDNIWLDWEKDWEHMTPEDLKDFKDFIDWYCVMISKKIELLDDDNLYRKWVEYCDQAADEPPYVIPHYADNDYYRDKLYSETYDYKITNKTYTLVNPVATWVASDPDPIVAWTIDDI